MTSSSKKETDSKFPFARRWSSCMIADQPVKYCFLCESPAESSCQWCRVIHYCSYEHYRVHRRKSKCYPFRIERKEGSAPRIIASRTIRANEVILSESSSISGPGILHSVPTCPICLQRIRSESESGQCPSGCPLPFCKSCSNEERSPQFSQHRYECRVLRENKVQKLEFGDYSTPIPIYSVITALRLMEYKKKRENLKDWKSFYDHLPDHQEERERRAPTEWNMLQTEVIDFIRKRLFMRNDIGNQELHRLLGIFMIKGVSLETRLNGGCGKALFPVFSNIQHDCLGNAKYSIDKDQRTITIRSRNEIPEGTAITVNYYTTSLLGTHKRRKKLESEYYFDCRCVRCSDPTELSTFISGLICEACETSILLPTDPLNPLSPWSCGDCDFHLTSVDAERIVDNIEDELTRICIMEKSLKALEDFIDHYEGRVLHPHHYLLLIAKRNYLFISRKRLIQDLARKDGSNRLMTQRQSLKNKEESFQDFYWIIQTLHCEDSF